MDIDVLVIGGGPAGLSAAASCADNGYSVICIEKKLSPGNPVHCAEGVGKEFLNVLPFRLPKEILRWKIDGVRINYNDESYLSESTIAKGFTVDRILLESWLNKRALSNGAKIIHGADLDTLKITKNGAIREVTFTENKLIKRLFPKIIIAADGADSKTLRAAGLSNEFKTDLINVYSWQVSDVELINSNYEDVFFNDNLGNGYGYIFPKSDTTANIGVGAVNKSMGELKSIFHSTFENLFTGKQKKIKLVNERSKAARFGDFKKRAFGGIIAVGDAANINYKPLIEGIIPGIISGHNVVKYIQGNSSFDNSEYEVFLEKTLPFWKENKNLQIKMNSLFNDRKNNSAELFAICKEIFNN